MSTNAGGSGGSSPRAGTAAGGSGGSSPRAGTAAGAARAFDLDRPWRIDDRVAVRPEPFGALLYHFGTRRLSFLKSTTVLTVVQSLAEHPSARSACAAAGVDGAALPAYERALATLAASQMIMERGVAGGKRGAAGETGTAEDGAAGVRGAAEEGAAEEGAAGVRSAAEEGAAEEGAAGVRSAAEEGVAS